LVLIDTHTARALVTALLFALALGFLYVARATLIAFLFAIFFAYLMSPLVNYLEKLLRGRGRAIAIIYALLLALVVMFFVSVGPRVTREGARLGQAIPALLNQLSSGQLAQQIGAQHRWNDRTTELLRSLLSNHSAEITQIAQRIGLRIADVAKQAWIFLVVPILSIFFLQDGQAFGDVLLGTVQSRPQRELLQGVLNDLNQMLAHFIRAQLTLAALTLVTYSIFLSAMKVPYALVLGTIGGLLEFIPVVGPAAALVVILVVCGVAGEGLIWIIVFWALYRIFQDYVLNPYLLGSGVEMHPLLVLFGVLAGEQIAGIPGMFFSVPTIAAVRVIIVRAREYRDVA